MCSLENGAEFLSAFHEINEDKGMSDIEVLPAYVEIEKNNPVERHIQTFVT